MTTHLASAIPIRALALIALGFTSAALILYPVEFRLEYTPIQSVDAIQMLWLFSVLLFVWIGLLLVLVWSTDKPWPTLGLITCFGIVYFSFWTLRFPYGFLETWHKMQGSQVIASTGNIEPSVMNYGGWPGLSIIGSAVSNLAGKDLISLNIPIVLFVQLAIPACLFALFLKLLGSTRAAALVVIVAVMANPSLERFQFHQNRFAIVLLLTGILLLLHLTSQTQNRSNNSILLLFVGTGVVVFHLYTGILLFSLAVITHLRGPLGFRMAPRLVDYSLSMVLFSLPVIWFLFWFDSTVSTYLSYIPDLIRVLADGGSGDQLLNLRLISSSNVVGIPQWANITRLGWMVGMLVIAPMASIWVLVRSSNFTPSMRICAIWLLAIVLINGAALLTSRGGEDFRRFLLYGSLLGAPMLIMMVRQYLGDRIGLAAVAVALLVVAVPTFLVNGNLVSTTSYYAEQQAAGVFLGRFGGPNRPGEGIMLHSVGSSDIGWYYLPFASWEPRPLARQATLDTKEWLRLRYERLAVGKYLKQDPEAALHIIWTDPSRIAQYTQWFGRDDASYVLEPVYTAMEQQTRFFDDGLVQLWTPK